MQNTPFLTEILEQTKALRDTYAFLEQDGLPTLQKINENIQKKKIRHLIFTGMGSSYFCAYLAKYFLNSHSISCEIQDTGEYLHYLVPDQVPTNVMIVLVSQSGESGEIVQLLRMLNDRGWKKDQLIGITNTPDSSLDQATQFTLFTRAGAETSVTSKSYTTALLTMACFSLYLTAESPFDGHWREKILDCITETENALVQGEETAQKILEFLGSIDRIELIGRGFSLATVHQSALNFKEVAKIYAEGLSGGMFRHGCIEMIDSNFRAIYLESDSTVVKINQNHVQNIAENWGKGQVIVITNKYEQWAELAENPNILVIKNPVKTPLLAPIYEIILLQFVFCLLAEKRGYVPGEFLYSSKITKD